MMLFRIFVVVTTAVLVLSWHSQSLCQGIIKPTDEGRVSLKVDRFRTAVQQSDTGKMVSVVGNDIIYDGVTSSRKSSFFIVLDSLFATAERRESCLLRPAFASTSGFWDFSIDSPCYMITGDSCVVSCRLRLYGSRAPNGRPYETLETLVFLRQEDGWKLTQVNDLIRFLREGGIQ